MVRTMQTMVSIIHFLMNDNHAVCALGLKRDPSQSVRKVFQALQFPDTFFSVVLKLPSGFTHNDVRVEKSSLTDQSLTKLGANDITYVSRI